MSEITKDYTIIEAGKEEKNYWQDLFVYRELFYFLAWRDVLVRYKQTIIGIIWCIIKPLLLMIVFTIIFGKLAKFPSDGVPYAILVYTALLPWQFYATSLTDSSNSLISNTNMVSKIYFPRIIIPTSSIIVNLFDFVISFLILLVLMIYYQFVPSWTILTVPFFLFIAILNTLGSGLWLSAINVKYRDVKYIVPFIIQLGLYISPVGFNSSIIPEQWRLIYSLNPMAGVIDGFRWAILGNETQIYMPGFILSCFVIILIFVTGIWYFRKTERTFADII
ncbi:MAG: ABC transporter permease [Cyanobacteriota bacterium]